MQQALRVRVGEPLAAYVPDLIEHLVDQGYSDRSVTDHVRHLAHVSRCLQRKGLDSSAVDERLIENLVDTLHRVGKGRKLTYSSFRVVLRFLHSRGIASPPPPEPLTPMGEVLAEYRRYLLTERALSPTTVPGYMRTASSFLTETCGADPHRVGVLTAGDVAFFVVAASRVVSRASANETVVGVRSLLRWLHLRGLIDKPLAQSAPWLARRRSLSPPRGVTAKEATALLGGCELGTLTGLRDFGVLIVLVRLGLRAGEVAAMEVGDIDWRRGELTVRGKGGWRDPLPLPVDVGEALAAYLARRGPEPRLSQVFLNVYAPRGSLTMTNVRLIVRRACLRVRLPEIGAHRLRHGVAAELLRHGAPLHEIGQVLRHRHLKTTARYAGVDFAALASVARPWPGGEA